MKNEHGPLTQQMRTRYRCRMLLPGWGDEGQNRIRNSTVLVAGAGGLGGAASVAGIGRIRICDADTVELPNLNCQVLQTEADQCR